jgi:hypothetical protein
MCCRHVRENQDACRSLYKMKKLAVYFIAFAIIVSFFLPACKKPPTGPGPVNTSTPTISCTPQDTLTPTITATVTETGTDTVTPTITATVTETGTDTVTETVTETVTYTTTPTNTPKLDIYEPDDSPADAKPITVDAPPQLHNLYNFNDVDYVTFNGIAGVNYLVRTIDVNGSTRPLALFASNGAAENITATANGQPWTYMHINCSIDSTYVVWVEDWSGIYGLDSDYDLDVITQPAIVPVDFNTAVDNASLVFTFDGDGTWVGQSNYSYTGGSAAQSPPIGDVQRASFSADVTGPCTVKFWWKISSELYCDELTFYVDAGSLTFLAASGERDWEQQTYVIGDSATHTLKWEYGKDISYASGYDTAWVDGIEVY